MSVTAKKRETKLTPKGRRKREAILDAALEIVMQEGLEAVSFGRIASALDVSKSGLFSHFSSKLELQLAVVERAEASYPAFASELEAPLGLPRLWAYVQAWERFTRRQHEEAGGAVFQALLTEYYRRPGPIQDRIKAFAQAFFGGLRALVAESVAEGHLRADLDPDAFAWQLQAFMSTCNQGQHLWKEFDLIGLGVASVRQLLEAAATGAAPALATS